MPGFNIGGINVGQPSNTLEGSDAHRAHRWKIISLLNVDFSNKPLYPLEVSLPAIIVEEETIAGANIDYRIPKKIKYGDFIIKFYDMIGALGKLSNEFNSMGILGEDAASQSGLKRADNYMKSVKIALLDGNGNVTRTFTGVNCYIKEVSHSELTYSGSDLKLFTLNIGCSYMTITESNGREIRVSVSAFSE